MIKKIKEFVKHLFESKLDKEVREFEAFLTSHLEERKEMLETLEPICGCEECCEVCKPKAKKPRAKKAATPRKPRAKKTKGASND